MALRWVLDASILKQPEAIRVDHIAVPGLQEELQEVAVDRTRSNNWVRSEQITDGKCATKCSRHFHGLGNEYSVTPVSNNEAVKYRTLRLIAQKLFIFDE
ncbi:hypothetical protein CEXT_708321 [Caerostris extrusa]|uniref:Uncharacterized protein n=1 Tax=Caerostris extrusa TaxID=172846 RepID=A0AAV4Q6B4_CAEEX|nr:hypothetical protein CEXT_708321 [Caerostris extrusa]